MILQKSAEIVLGFSMGADEAYPFIKNAIDGNSQFRLTNGDRGAMKMQLMKLDDDRSQHYFELAISDNSESICTLHFTTARAEDTQMLAKLAQDTLWIIGEYGYKTGAFWSNDWLVRNEVTITEVENVTSYLREQPMATVEEISDALTMLQVDIAICLFKISEKGILNRSSRDVKPNRYFIS